MLFNSWQFILLLTITFALYWAIPHKFRWILLLLSSFCFYLSAGLGVTLMLVIIAFVSYVAALAMDKTDNKKQKKVIICISLPLCFLGLLVFKYLGFLLETLDSIVSVFALQLHHTTIDLILPIGISFYTFSIASYVIDVYKGKITAEHHFGIYLLYVTYFPKILAGPIERSKNFLTQIKEEKCFDSNRGIYGLKLMLWGFFKKLVIADTLAIYVDIVFDNIYAHQGFSLVLAAVMFTIQIYCDFSGYSDIARGTSALLGIELMENFKSPYFSASIKEFWSKWHISLSIWFRDYVYIPLGGNRVKKAREYFNLIITFLLSGLWHGANWTFVIWGGLHGCAQAFEKMLGIKSPKKRKGFVWLARCLLVFVFVSCAWVFFRASTFGEAIYLFANSFDGISSPLLYLKTGFDGISMTMGGLVDFMIFMIPLILCDYFSGRADCNTVELLSKKHSIVQWSFYVLIGLIVVFMSQKGVAAEFVYMQF